jgi:hypothetical protein
MLAKNAFTSRSTSQTGWPGTFSQRSYSLPERAWAIRPASAVILETSSSTGDGHPFDASVGTLTARRWARSLAAVIARNMAMRLPAMVISATGPAISPFSMMKPEAPRL